MDSQRYHLTRPTSTVHKRSNLKGARQAQATLPLLTPLQDMLVRGFYFMKESLLSCGIEKAVSSEVTAEPACYRTCLAVLIGPPPLISRTKLDLSLWGTHISSMQHGLTITETVFRVRPIAGS